MILEPGCTELTLDMPEGALGHREDMSDEYREPHSRSLYPDSIGPQSLLQWAVTENGDYCYWVTDAASPNDWTVAISTRKGWKWSFCPGGMVDFLVALVDGSGSVSGEVAHFAEAGDGISFDEGE